MGETRSDRSAYFRMMSRSGNPASGEKRDSLALRLGENQLKLEEAVYTHFREIEKMLNEEQRKRFDRVIEQVMQRRDNRIGRPGGPPRRFRGRGY